MRTHGRSSRKTRPVKNPEQAPHTGQGRSVTTLIGGDCQPNGVSGPTRRRGWRGRSCDDREDHERELDAEGSQEDGLAQRGRAGRGPGAGQGCPSSRGGPHRPGRAAEVDHRHRAGECAGGGDDRAPRSRQAPGTHGRERKHPQRHPTQDGADRRGRGGDDRRPAGPGRHVRAGHRQEATASALGRGRGRDQSVRQGSDDRGDQRALPGGLRRQHLQGHGQPDHGQGARGDGHLVLPTSPGRLRGDLHRRDLRQGP